MIKRAEAMGLCILPKFGKIVFFGVKNPEKTPYFSAKCKCQYSFCARRSYMMKLKYVFNHIVEHLG